MKPPQSDHAAAIPTKVGMALLLGYWVVMGTLLAYGLNNRVPVEKVAQGGVQGRLNGLL